ncbi:uncharacterized protein BDR25DRAFT_94322 [Lindgomyces ingoldianus]|uniref:Uncharacterized protein n=1 Tax=Lindgomyces ingoldianus TaxID=673940 RepID=A0ACB6QD97_9PLEO|nr:uncharacterized protein BDR25DRAFT_94322 [Lindgomyces ingoldianus]KAF2464959.1 hypothetical protein BDR25DRAFT_94322 [Lindgomyces ingoldianus]
MRLFVTPRFPPLHHAIQVHLPPTNPRPPKLNTKNLTMTPQPPPQPTLGQPPSLSTTLNPPSGPSSPQASNSAFTRTQRSAQARNKPFSTASTLLAASTSAETQRGKSEVLGGPSMDTYEQAQLRNQAAEILESVELLIWYSASRNEVRHPPVQTPYSLD